MTSLPKGNSFSNIYRSAAIPAKNSAAAAGMWSPAAVLAAREVVEAGAVDVADAEVLEWVLVIVLEAAAEAEAEDVAA